MTRALLAAAVAAALLLVLPALPVGWFVRGQVRLVPDAVACVALVWVLQWPSGWGRSAVPSWRAGVAAVPWTVLVVFEVVRAITRQATNEDLPLYDAFLLSKHLVVLGTDLYGAAALVPVAVAAVAPAAIGWLGALLLGRVEVGLLHAGRRGGTAFAIVATLVAVAADRAPGVRPVGPILLRNVRASYELWAEVEESVQRTAQGDLEALPLDPRPDLLVYVIESYGEVCASAPDLAGPWGESVDALERSATEAGFATASGWSTAPVHGGRSWIADLAVLSGIRVAHQSSFEHVIGRIDDVATLPSLLSRRGYATVLVKPADRARPGVVVENPYRFGRTVFGDDLGYTGPYVGWGRIPDQYTIEFVQERVLDGIDEPRFAFFHLATAHLPWVDVPPVVGDWEAWNRGEVPGRDLPVWDDRSTESELWMRVARFRRRLGGFEREADRGQRDQYLGTVRYDLEALRRRLAEGARRPALVVVMGDHQPPLLAEDRGPEVPVHLFATDAAMLGPFLAAGFGPGARPGPSDPVRHEDLLALLVRALDAAP